MPSIQDYIADPSLLSQSVLASLSTDEIAELAQQVVQLRDTTRQQRQLELYEPASDEALQVHLSTATECLLVGGNRSSKTETMMVEWAIQMTGVVPICLRDIYPREKLRTPVRTRIVCESLTNTWAPVIRPKLQWWQWSGRGESGGPNGHWGWIPPEFLIKQKWDESWLEKERMLKLVNGSTCQVMSYDQDVQDFSGSSLHLICHDEGPPEPLYRENKMRIIDTNGRMMIAMTPPDEESTSWRAAWIYDELWEKRDDPTIDVFQLFTVKNRILDPEMIAKVTSGLSAQQLAVRLEGQFMHLSGRIYPVYSDRASTWCFTCQNVSLVLEGLCAKCGGNSTVQFCHYIEPISSIYGYPGIFCLDPHPRKPHAMAWYVVAPSDDIFQVAELEVDGEPDMVWQKARDLETKLGIDVVRRLMDPNMAKSPAGVTNKRGRTVRDEFDAVGLRCDLADDNRETARARLTAYLKPDPRTREPRFFVFNTCTRTNYMFHRYVWDEHMAARSAANKDPKALPAQKNDDFPALAQYMVNSNPTYAGLRGAGRFISGTRTRRKGAY